MAKRLKWGSLENLNNIIDDYFEHEPVPSIVGLRLALGISDECWKWYSNDRWKTHRKSEEEIEELRKREEGIEGEECFQDWEEISPKVYLVEEFSQSSREENYTIKTEVSAIFKKARDRIEESVIKMGYASKNPAFSIFYSKAALGYRETAPEGGISNQLPSKITIEIMPPPNVQQISSQQPIKVEIEDKK